MQAAREIAAAAGALFAYLTTVLPRVRKELKGLGPLPEEKVKNAEAVAVFATLAPRRHRAAVVRAIVALQVAIDLRDELEEAGEDAFDPRIGDLRERSRHEVASLPSHRAVNPWLQAAVGSCAEAQLLTHRAAREGAEVLQRWARRQQQPSEYRWWEVAAGATSSVAAHALIAAAAVPDTTAMKSGEIVVAYNPPIGALTVLLDDLVDFEEDREAGEHNYVSYYENPTEAADRLALIARRAVQLIESLPQSSRHRAILAGVAAFYLTAPSANSDLGRAVRAETLPILGPGARVLATFMRLRRAGERKRPGRAGSPPEP
jgi:tetraprenyl-beta-curcumene synthase